MTSTVYTVGNDSRITGLQPESAPSDFISRFSVTSGYQAVVFNAAGGTLSGAVGTACRMQIRSGSTVAREYQVILFGDANGDGKINVLDLTLISRHIMRRTLLGDLYATGADANHDGKINVLDKTVISRHIMRRTLITQ